MWGAKKFLFFYFSCGVGAALIHSGVNYYEIHALLNQLENTSITSADIHTILNTDFVSGNQYYGKLLYENAAATLDKLKINDTDFGLLFNAAVKTQSAAVGASGAIYGLLVAFAFMFPNAELMMMFIPVPVKAKYFVPVIVLLDLFSGVTGFSLFGGNIAHFAHVGGALIGFVMMWYWKKNQFDKNRWDR